MSFSWFISVDDHLIEPARLWQDRVPAKWRDIAPRIVREGDSEHWVYEDREIVTTGLNAVAGKSREEFSPEPITYEDMREGCYEPSARVADMDQGNVLASMQERREFGAVVLMVDEGVRLEHGVESLARVAGLMSEPGEVLKVAGDLALVPGDQDLLDA